MFVHAVYFWLRPDLTDAERARFVEALHTLPAIGAVAHGYAGVPAPTDRPVIDRSYSHALVLVFRDQAAHDAYQVDPAHLRFVEGCAALWERVRIYDSVGGDGR